MRHPFSVFRGVSVTTMEEIGAQLSMGCYSVLSHRTVTEKSAGRTPLQTIREWSQKFGGTYAKRMRSKRHRLGGRWHLYEVILTINGKLQYLWRAVDQDGDALDILVQPRWNKKAAKKFFRKR
jgi:putative transposase